MNTHMNVHLDSIPICLCENETLCGEGFTDLVELIPEQPSKERSSFDPTNYIRHMHIYMCTHRKAACIINTVVSLLEIGNQCRT